MIDLQNKGRRLLALLASGLHSLATWLAEWAGMHKRIEVICRNPGLEGTESALGSYAIDFEADEAFSKNRIHLVEMLTANYPVRSIVLENDRGESMGFNPEYYVSHRVSSVDQWIATIGDMWTWTAIDPGVRTLVCRAYRSTTRSPANPYGRINA